MSLGIIISIAIIALVIGYFFIKDIRDGYGQDIKDYEDSDVHVYLSDPYDHHKGNMH